MKISEICKNRKISIIDVSTPLIAPSFSSRGFPDIRDMYISMKNYISNISLLSAYDIYYEMPEMNIYASDIIFIDSGGYETKPIKMNAFSDDVYAKRDSIPIRPWTRELHQLVLDNLQNLSQLILISYDDWDNPQPILSQIETAKLLFQRYPNFASNFLYKPETSNCEIINIASLLDNSHHLTSFSILGITEKELGSSILERCCNLLKLRSKLQEQDIQIPIHILGCLDPALIISYFLCGADIFDGLAWLRYAFIEGLTLYQSTATILQANWSNSESDMTILYSIKNIEYINHLSQAMRRFCQTQSLQEFFEWRQIVPQVVNLVKEVGIEIEE